jgi:hypothetical protein
MDRYGYTTNPDNSSPIERLFIDTAPINVDRIQESTVVVPVATAGPTPGEITVDFSGIIPAGSEDLVATITLLCEAPIAVTFFGIGPIVVNGSFVLTAATGSTGLVTTDKTIVLDNSDLVNAVPVTVQVAMLPVPA